jgi:hypothetical protein
VDKYEREKDWVLGGVTIKVRTSWKQSCGMETWIFTRLDEDFDNSVGRTDDYWPC